MNYQTPKSPQIHPTIAAALSEMSIAWDPNTTAPDGGVPLQRVPIANGDGPGYDFVVPAAMLANNMTLPFIVDAIYEAGRRKGRAEARSALKQLMDGEA